jgi:PRC-barrel domain
VAFALGPINSMRRFLTLLAALAIAATLAIALVVVAPAAQPEQAQLTAKVDPTPVGLPVFSSDGKQLGKVLAEGIDEDDQPVLVAEIERPLGIARRSAAIPTYMFVRRSNRIVLTITAEEVADRLFPARP